MITSIASLLRKKGKRSVRGRKWLADSERKKKTCLHFSELGKGGGRGRGMEETILRLH